MSRGDDAAIQVDARQATAADELDLAQALAARHLDGLVGERLLRIARGAIAAALGEPVSTPPAARWLAEPAATFVTLRIGEGELRGCMGSLEAHRPLAVDVRRNALAAAFEDPRFAPVAAVELVAVRVEVSLLSPPEPLRVTSEAELVASLRPGIDGLILAAGMRRATFLPQVWEDVPEPRAFVHLLERKAGLPAGGWPEGMAVWRYTVRKWAEDRPLPARHRLEID